MFTAGCSLQIRKKSAETESRKLWLYEVEVFNKNGTVLRKPMGNLAYTLNTSSSATVPADACFDGVKPTTWLLSGQCATASNVGKYPMLTVNFDCSQGLTGVSVYNTQTSNGQSSPQPDITYFELVVTWRGVPTAYSFNTPAQSSYTFLTGSLV